MANKLLSVDVRTLYSYGPVCIIQVLGNTGKIRSKPGHKINSLGHFRKLVEIRSPKCSLDEPASYWLLLVGRGQSYFQ